MHERRAVIYCSANYDIDPKFNQAAREVVRAACLRGYTIVSGGTVKGTMGVVSRSVVEFGGRHRGIIPRFMKDFVFPDMDETVWTDIQGRGSVDGIPRMGSHGWPEMNHAVITIVEDDKVQPLLDAVKAKDEESRDLGLRAFVWNVEIFY